ncbi:MAG TPA: hypothetical protein VMR81_06905 [Patescibacteria group bacterium]|nr:hypothetical protein [Patescibacteria group bacterium]
MHQAILLLFSIASIVSGYVLVNRWKSALPFALFRFVAAFLIGTVVSVSLAYVLASLLPRSLDRIFVASLSYSFLIFLYFLLRWKSCLVGIKKEIRSALKERFDMTVLLFSLIFSFWLMFKSFRMGTGSVLLIGSNEVFDFGHALSIVRSFSWGNNLPFLSPFVANAVHVYHFMFYFWVGMYEHLGVPIVWAVNIPSALTYACLLVVIYFIPRVLTKAPKIVGLFAVLFTILHSTLTFIFFFEKYGVSIHALKILWRLPKYFFAGPFDGSPISIYWTLNVFVNQRHLALGIAIALLVGLVVFQECKKKTWSMIDLMIVGILTGLLAFWHIVMFGILLGTVGILLLINRKYRQFVVYIIASLICSVPTLMTWVRAAMVYITPAVRSSIPLPTTHVPILLYIIYNYGILLFSVPIGLFVMPRQYRIFFATGLVMFIVGILAKVLFVFDIDQKFGNYTVIFANIISSYLIYYMWRKKNTVLRGFAVIFILFLTISGVIDLMVIKNDFGYPVTDAPQNTFIEWIRNSTSQRAVFVENPDIFDPVVLAGRRNFYGFFQNTLTPDRSHVVKLMFEQPKDDGVLMEQYNVSYIVVPKKPSPDFRYTINVQLFQQYLRKVFENGDVIVFSI